MDAEEGPLFDWVESSAVREIDANFRDTFCLNPEDSKLQITRFFETAADNGGGMRGCYAHSGPIAFSDEIDYFAVCHDLGKWI
jgi:hypothetical protein